MNISGFTSGFSSLSLRVGSENFANVNSSKNRSLDIDSLKVTINSSAKANAVNSAELTSPTYNKPTRSLPFSGLANEGPRIAAESSLNTGKENNLSTAPGKARSEEQAEARSEKKNQDGFTIELSEEELKVVEELKARDREVRAHEQAHKTVGGQYTGAISFSYQSGPDGKRYAVGGEVPIDVSPVPGNPQATISKMTIVKAAATAPAQPSTQDIMVAAEAGRILMAAQSELQQQKRTELSTGEQSSSEKKSAAVKQVESETTPSGFGVDKQIGALQRIASLGSEFESRVDILV